MKKPIGDIDSFAPEVIKETMEAYGDRTVYAIPEDYVGRDKDGEYVLSSRGQNYLRDKQRYSIRRDDKGRATVEFFYSRGD